MDTVNVKKEVESTTLSSSSGNEKNLQSTREGDSSFDEMTVEEMNTSKGMETALQRMRNYYDEGDDLALSFYVKMLPQIEYNIIKPFSKDMAMLLDNIFDKRTLYRDVNIIKIVRLMRSKLFENFKNEKLSEGRESPISNLENWENSCFCGKKRHKPIVYSEKNLHPNLHGDNDTLSPSPIKKKRAKNDNSSFEMRHRKVFDDNFSTQFTKNKNNTKSNIWQRLSNIRDHVPFNQWNNKGKGNYYRKNFRGTSPYTTQPIDNRHTENIHNSYRKENPFIYERTNKINTGRKFIGKENKQKYGYVDYPQFQNNGYSRKNTKFLDRNSSFQLNDITNKKYQSEKSYASSTITKNSIHQNNGRSRFNNHTPSKNHYRSESQNVASSNFPKKEGKNPLTNQNNSHSNAGISSPINNYRKPELYFSKSKAQTLRIYDCKYFKKGVCRFGLRCYYLHGTAPTVGYKNALKPIDKRRSRSVSNDQY